MRKTFSLSLALSLVAAAAGCHHPNDYRPSAITVVSVSAAPTSIPADGVTTTRISAQIDKDADGNKRTITFRTTAGTFVPAADPPRQATVTADALGVATIDLKSEIGKTSALVEASITTATATVQVTFSNLTAQDVFALSSASSSIPADGFSEVIVSAQLKRTGLTDADRDVVFQTSSGTLRALGRFQGPEAGASVTALADSDGVARVALRSAKDTGTARVSATALGFAQQVEIAFGLANPTDTITVSASPTIQDADGDALVTVTATIAAGIPAAKRTVKFTTTLGQFVGGDEDAAGIDNRARAFLKSSSIGRAQLSATVDGTRAPTSVEFRTAFPDRIVVLPQAPTVQADASGAVEIRVRLLRNAGSVSDDLQPAFSPVNDTGQTIGTFTAVTLSKLGDASAQFRPGATPHRGPVTIRVTVPGSSATGVATVVVVDP